MPLVYGLTAWGIHSTFVNPYYVESALPAFNYSQPITINVFDAPADGDIAGTPEPLPGPEESPEVREAYGVFENARQAFAAGEYARALELTEQSIRRIPNDPILHEFAALSLFATGDFDRAAIILNSLLAAAPGMDWTTLIGLYRQPDDYTQQLRKLEEFTRQHPSDAGARFVLAYHYLILGHVEAATKELQAVVKLQPNDRVAQWLLDSLQAPEPGAEGDAPAGAKTAADAQKPDAANAKPAVAATAEPREEDARETDLVGQWRAEREGDAFDLTVDEDWNFVWKATPRSGAPVTLSGTVDADYDTLVLESEQQGALAAQVASKGPDAFEFILPGGPRDDPGLTFRRVKPKAD